jgi:hypothetical protein
VGKAAETETVRNFLRFFGNITAVDSIEVRAAQEKSARRTDEFAMILPKRSGAIGTHLVDALHGEVMVVLGRVIAWCCGLRFSAVDHAGTRKCPSRDWTVTQQELTQRH